MESNENEDPGSEPAAEPAASRPDRTWARIRLALIAVVALAHVAWQAAVNVALLPNALLVIAALVLIALAVIGLAPQYPRFEHADVRGRVMNLLLGALTVVLVVGMYTTVFHVLTDKMNAILTPVRSAAPLDMERRFRITGPYVLAPLDPRTLAGIRSSFADSRFRAIDGRLITVADVPHGILAIGDAGMKSSDDGFLLGLFLGMTKDGINGNLETIDGIRVAHARSNGVDIVMWSDLPAVYVVYVNTSSEVNQIVHAVLLGAPPG